MNFDSVLVFSTDPKKLSDFYGKVFETKPGWEEHGYYGYKVGSGYVMFGPHDQIKGKTMEPARIIINFSVKDVQKEFDRIRSLGTKVVKAPYHPGEADDMTLATFEDPDGNYFQIGSEMK